MARPMSAKLMACIRLLRLIKELGPRIVVADDLAEAGIAVAGGYARAEDSHEGPIVYLTPAGEIAVACF